MQLQNLQIVLSRWTIPIALVFHFWFVVPHSAFAQLTGARHFKSGPIQITGDGASVWMAHADHDAVSRLDTATEMVESFPLPAGGPHKPRGLSVREDGSEVWVACHDSDRVFVMAGDSGEVLADIALPWGSGPLFLALSPDQSQVLVTLHRAAELAVLDASTREVSAILGPADISPAAVAWSEDGTTAIVTHLFAEGEHPFLSHVDFSGPAPVIRSQIRVLPTDPRHSGQLAPPYDIAEGGYLTMRGHPAQIPTGTGRNEMWLPMQYNNITEDRYSPDSTVQSAVRRLLLDTMTIPNGVPDKWIFSAVHIHDPSGSNPYLGPGWNAGVSGPIDIGFSQDGGMAYVLHELSEDLVAAPVNTPLAKPAGAEPLREIGVGKRPMGLAISPVAPRAYVYNFLSRDVSVIDLESQTELRRVEAIPDVPEPVAQGLLNGARLFHTSNDPRISSNQKVSCASCHINGEHDGRSWAFHRLPGAHGPREVPSLLGLSLTMRPRDAETGLGQLHRSGDRDEIEDFEWTFQGPLMGGTGFLGAEAHPELGLPNAGRDTDLTALARYIRSLPPIMRSPYRSEDGTLSAAAVRGATFFAGTNRVEKMGDAGCVQCHVPETGFVDFKFHDVGSRRPGNEEELNNREPVWHVNTPTLIGLWTTRPYNGVSGYASTILDVLQDQAARANSSTPHGRPDGLTRRQLKDLEAFVLSIDGNMTGEEVRGARDEAPPYLVRASPTSLSRLEVWFNETVAEAGAEDTNHWRLTRVGHGPVPIHDVVYEATHGDRVTLRTQLQPQSEYRLVASGGIQDRADDASGGTSNALDEQDPRNTVSFSVGSSLSVTLGASGYENMTIPVHDSAMIGPNLSTWGHDSVWLFPVNSGPRVNTGFVRFDWRAEFQAKTGVDGADQIQKAAWSMAGEFGDAPTLELRRVLQSWSDPAAGNDFNSNPSGAPTWRDHAHPNGRWNSAGAGRLGGTGNIVSDYNGAWDLAAQVDLQTTLDSINSTVWFEGPLITEAFKFWFQNPAVDYGYAVRLSSDATQDMKFHRVESGFQEHGPVLALTYELPTPPRLTVPMLQADGGATLELHVEPWNLYRVEVSTNFIHWNVLTNGLAFTSPVTVRDMPAGSSNVQRFYRASLVSF